MEEQSAFKVIHEPWIFQLYTAVAQKSKQQLLMLTTIIAPQPKAAKQDVNCAEGLRMWTPLPPPSRPTVAPMHNNRSRMTPEEKIHILQYGIFFFSFTRFHHVTHILNLKKKIPASVTIHLLNNLQLASDTVTYNAIFSPAAACYCTIKHGKHSP